MWWRVPSQINSSGRNFCCKLLLVFCFILVTCILKCGLSCKMIVRILVYLVSLHYFSHTCLLCAGNSASYHLDIRTHVYDGNWYSVEVWSSPGILISLQLRIWEIDLGTRIWTTDVCWSALWILLVSCPEVPCVFYWGNFIYSVLNFWCNTILLLMSTEI